MNDDTCSQAGVLFSSPLLRQTNPPHRILLVDDDRCLSQFNAAALARFDYGVTVAHDGAAAWAALNEGDYDLIITDNDMPVLTGVELLQQLRAARMVVPVIMATLTPPLDEFARRPWLRPAAALVKPFTIGELVSTVKKVLREADSPVKEYQLTTNDPQDNSIPQAEAPAGLPGEWPINSAHRILVVDGDEALRQLYAEALARPGFYVDVVEDGIGGWQALQANNYNLLITENDVPKLSGVELVKKLRAAHMALPVVMAADRLPVHELARNPALQLAATLVKPFAVDDLLSTVKILLHAMDNSRGQPAAQAPVTTQAPRQIHKHYRDYSRWGLNE